MDIRTGEILQQYDSTADDITDISFNSDGSAVIALQVVDVPDPDEDHYSLTMWDVDTGKILRQFDSPEFLAMELSSIALSPDGTTAV
jgi:WD40 repeat protein